MHSFNKRNSFRIKHSQLELESEKKKRKVKTTHVHYLQVQVCCELKGVVKMRKNVNKVSKKADPRGLFLNT